jgi:hypothetical protein
MKDECPIPARAYLSTLQSLAGIAISMLAYVSQVVHLREEALLGGSQRAGMGDVGGPASRGPSVHRWCAPSTHVNSA